MKQQMIDHIDDPSKLEQLYRQDRRGFEKNFAEISGSYDTPLVNFWKNRLAPDTSSESKVILWKDLRVVIILALVAAVPAVIPAIFTGIDKEFFYLRNLPLLALNGIILYTFWLHKKSAAIKSGLYILILHVVVFYINLLPGGPRDSVQIAALHVPLLFWCLFGLAFLKGDYRSVSGRMEFISFNGELIIMTGLILLAGGVLTGITLGLFGAIGMEIMEFYTGFIALPGAVAAPVLAYFLIRTFPSITNKIAPVIARIFTPVVLVTLTVYLISLLFSKISIADNRDLLIVFNAMLLGVLALIIFSVSGIGEEKSGNKNQLILILLSVAAIVINSIALSAIISRVMEGLTPNRLVVLITNLLIFINLILIAVKLIRIRFKGVATEGIEKTVAGYLTVYAIWTVIAIFILPLAFGFR
ncbi:MAG: hypothetical protein WC699_03205 [Bacteroidales bacterium]